MRYEQIGKQPMRRIDQLPQYAQERAELANMSSLKGVLSRAEDIARHNIGPFIQQEIPTLSPDHPQLDAVLTRGDYSGVGKNEKEYGLLLHANSLRQQIAREIVLDQLREPGAQERLHLSPEQYTLLTYGLQIQQQVDTMHVKWYEEMVAKDGAKDLVEKMKDPAFKDAVLGPEHGDFVYGIVRQDEQTGDYRYLTYAQAYPQEISAMTGLMKQLVDDLQPLAEQGSYEAATLIATHEKLITLLGITAEGESDTSVTKRQKEAQKELDTVWDSKADPSKMNADILYPMETYAAVPFVEMQYDILIKAPEYDSVNAAAEKTKQKMMEVFSTEEDFTQLPTLQGSLRILESTDGYVYLRFISGTALGFRSGASNVPNDPEVRLADNTEKPGYANGSKINYDMETFKRRSEIAQGLLNTAFGEKGAARVFGNLEEHLLALVGNFISGHEDAHNVLERADTMKVLGEHNHMLMDETKADLAGLITCLTPGFLDPETRSDIMLGLLAEELRGMSRWGERATDPAHLNGNIVLYNLFFKHGIISFNADGLLHVDTISSEKMDALREGAKQVFLALAQAYEATDVTDAHQKAESFQQAYFVPSRQTLRLIRQAGIISEDEYRHELIFSLPKRRVAIKGLDEIDFSVLYPQQKDTPLRKLDD